MTGINWELVTLGEQLHQLIQAVSEVSPKQLEVLMIAADKKQDEPATEALRMMYRVLALYQTPGTRVEADIMRFVQARLEEKKIGEAGAHLSLAAINNS